MMSIRCCKFVWFIISGQLIGLIWQPLKAVFPAKSADESHFALKILRPVSRAGQGLERGEDKLQSCHEDYLVGQTRPFRVVSLSTSHECGEYLIMKMIKKNRFHHSNKANCKWFYEARLKAISYQLNWEGQLFTDIIIFLLSDHSGGEAIARSAACSREATRMRRSITI